jgi:MoaA/NifB/PqqE/SkfB family radical SAM enzyme
MKLQQKLSIGLNIVRAKLLRQRIPVLVGWAVTYRCNKECAYCHWRTVQTPELTTEQIKVVIDKLCMLGLRMLIITGGEPFLRDDIVEIINYGEKKKIIICVNSNGSGISKHIRDLKFLDCLNLSLEGPRVIHDAIRGSGSFDEVVESARLAKEQCIPVTFTTTLNALNLQAIDFVLDLAHELKTKVTFQLLHAYCLGSDIANPLVPETAPLQSTLRKIYCYKIEGKYKKIIANSTAALHYFLYWPDLPSLKCASGKIMFRLTPQGRLIACADDLSGATQKHYLDIVTSDVKQLRSFFACSSPIVPACRCGCSNKVETALLWNFNARMIIDYL